MDTFPLTVWHYRLHLEIEGADRYNLPDALEGEDLLLFESVPRETAYEQIREGFLSYDVSFREPRPAFVEDLTILSMYLFQIVRGLEVAQRYVSKDVSDDARAWKVVARRGEWVKLPLVIARPHAGLVRVDEEADDLTVIRARWEDYPRWFQDGMRRKHPSLRSL